MEIKLEYDDCDYCAVVEYSGGIDEARLKGTLIHSYRLIDYQDRHDISYILSGMDFWQEHIKIKNNGTGEVFDDTVLMWTKDKYSEPLHFKLLNNDKYVDMIETVGYGSTKNNFSDSIYIGLFMEEQVNQGEFVYVKE